MEKPTENDDIDGSAEATLQPGLQPATPTSGIGNVTDPISTTRWCSKCAQPVIPRASDPHRCPFCTKFIAGNAANAKDPVSQSRQQDLQQKFERDYEPATEAERVLVRLLARFGARSEVTKNISEQSKLVQMMTAVIGSLNDTKNARQTSAPMEPDRFADLSEEELLDAHDRIRADIIALITSKRDHQARLAEELRAESEVAQRELQQSQSEAALVPPSEAEDPPCPFCQQPVSNCTAFRNRQLSAWQAVHYDAPAEIERRRQERTAEMLDRVGKPHPWL